MYKVVAKHRQGNKIVAYDITDGNYTSTVSKEQLISLIENKQVINATTQKAWGNTIVRLQEEVFTDEIKKEKSENVRSGEFPKRLTQEQVNYLKQISDSMSRIRFVHINDVPQSQICYMENHNGLDIINGNGRIIVCRSPMIIENGLNFKGLRCYELSFAHNSVDTSKITNTNGMFSECEISELNISGFNTTNVQDMTKMFAGSKFQRIIFGSIDTSNVQNMQGMFMGSLLNEPNFAGLNTGRVRSMQCMFMGFQCPRGTLHIDSFDTSSLVNAKSMFKQSKIKNLVLNNFVNSNLATVASMFEDACIGQLQIDGFSTSRVREMNRMFKGFQTISPLNLNSLSTESLENYNREAIGMFYGCNIEQVCATDKLIVDQINMCKRNKTGIVNDNKQATSNKSKKRFNADLNLKSVLGFKK